MLKAIENVARHIFSIFPGKIQIKIGWVLPIEIDEAFEVEVEVDGIYVGDSKQVGNNAEKSGQILMDTVRTRSKKSNENSLDGAKFPKPSNES